MKLPKKPLALVRALATKQVIKQFTAKYGFVYFGHVDAQRDEHQLVRGVTVSAAHSDGHYAVGTYKGHDITIVERHVTLAAAQGIARIYRWLIMQVDLVQEDLPHLFLDAHHHDAAFYTSFFTKFGYFETANHLLAYYDALFLARFKVFARAADFMLLQRVLDTESAAMLAHHFYQFDYEIEDDTLRIYATSSVITLHMLQEMMRVGIWFADQLNRVER